MFTRLLALTLIFTFYVSSSAYYPVLASRSPIRFEPAPIPFNALTIRQLNKNDTNNVKVIVNAIDSIARTKKMYAVIGANGTVLCNISSGVVGVALSKARQIDWVPEFSSNNGTYKSVFEMKVTNDIDVTTKRYFLLFAKKFILLLSLDDEGLIDGTCHSARLIVGLSDSPTSDTVKSVGATNIPDAFNVGKFLCDRILTDEICSHYSLCVAFQYYIFNNLEACMKLFSM
ncbi:hypothetical protein HT594_00033 [Phenacoccus solenopsis nudivirus]|nr:hypothetical protein HT594_00033 [Phenacoccus solenopsis nudivirus]